MPPQQRLECLYSPLSQYPAQSVQQLSRPVTQEALPQPVVQVMVSTQIRQGGVYGQTAPTSDGKIIVKPSPDKVIPTTKQQDKMKFFIGRFLLFCEEYFLL
jgi:hypothetical protein